MAAKREGTPKSAPAFTKFMARFIQQAVPEAKVQIIGRLRLDVEMPRDGHTTDLHNIYNACQRDRDNCAAEVTYFVAQSVQVYRAADIQPTRDKLRIVVRPSAYMAMIRANPKRDKPIATPLVGDYWTIAVIDAPTSITYMDENDLPGVALTSKAAFALASKNTRLRLHQSLQEELRKGPCRGIMGGDDYTASIVAFPDLWADAATHKCHGNLLIAIPATDVIVYSDGSKPGAISEIANYADRIMAKDGKPFSDAVFRWTPKGWVLAQGPSGRTK